MIVAVGDAQISSANENNRPDFVCWEIT